MRGFELTDNQAVLRDDFVIVKLAQVVVAINGAQGRGQRCDEMGHFEVGSSTVADDQ